MRADRLVATLLLMQARGRVTAGELASELEISVATARRDLEALSSAGIPVYPRPGRGGGWSLLGGSRTDLSGLNSSEARALFLLIGPAASVNPEAKSALRKLVRALPETFRADAEAAADAVVIDPTRWGARDPEPSGLVDLLQDAVVRRRRVRLTYAAWNREPTERLVDPWGMAEKNNVWYLIGGTDAGQRTYRVDRVTAVSVTDDAAERPHDFELGTAWDRVVGEIEEQRSGVWALVVVDSAWVPTLRKQFGRQFVIDDEVDSGRTRVRVAASTAGVLARQIAGWGAHAEVLEPESVIAELATIGAQLVAKYGD
ncbi:helix-turn-helix transcriptional regulator [Glaciibacter superstes]|uniref:helix-turn-helix transcriptional regulator n=1 Tax=Glaciibacter superstes TaxID=501023 RepID=UPI0003B76338|nr:WYL domain-containing protein [Glaciibacter superstes]